MDNIDRLRAKMKENKVDMYLVTSDDFHGSEFTGKYFKTREYLSGFTGSAGILIVTMTDAALWTDGRYYLQAEDELKNTQIRLFKDGMPGVETYISYIYNNLKENMTLGFDGRCIMASTIIAIKKHFQMLGINIRINGEMDLAGEIWKDRPKLPNAKAFVLDKKYTGEDAADKIKRLRLEMNKHNSSYHVICSLDDICWLLNIRGRDIDFCPLVMSFLIVSQENIWIFVNNNKIENIREYLNDIGVLIRPYEDIYNAASNIEVQNDSNIMCDLSKLNYRLYNSIKNNRILNIPNPTTDMKSIKNDVELENIKLAHIKDAIAYIRFLMWFEDNKTKCPTELEVATALLKQRQQMENFLEESFESIVAYGENGAIVHYSPFTKDNNTKLDKKSLVLIDTGGHYLNGTTDITRTLVCGELTPQEKKDFTLVLKGNLSLSNVRIPKGISGVSLDAIARAPIWKEGRDFNHGTGHGVGYLLNVHEGPQNISFRTGRRNVAFKAGMLTSNEPGIYIKGSYGIRLENLMFCKESKENNDFLEFETVTMVPFDVRAIDYDLLSDEELRYLNEYHDSVVENLAPYLNNEETVFLKKYINR